MEIQSLDINEMGFILKSNTEEKIVTGNTYVLKTNFGRIYINSRVKDYELITPNRLRIGTDIIDLSQQNQFNNIMYIHPCLRDCNVSTLLEYFRVSDYFLEKLINENISCSFESISFLKDISLSETDKHNLLKPVYYRYISTKRNNPLALKKIQESLSKRNRNSDSIGYETMVLYDIPCIIKDSELRILDNFWIDISECLAIKVQNKYYSFVYNCISLGVSKFSRVEIVFEKITNLGSNNVCNILCGQQIKEIKLIKD